MIKTLSPYNLTIPFVSPLTSLTCTSFTLKLFIWDGLKSSVPASATWEMTKDNPTGSTGNVKINIARLLNDFIDFTQKAGTGVELLDGNNQRWVKWQTTYETTNPTDATTPSNQNTKLFSKGYSYGLDGENANTPTNKILIPIIDYKVARNTKFIVPIEIDETSIVLGTLVIDSITSLGGGNYTLAFTQTGIFEEKFYTFKLNGSAVWTLGVENSLTSPFDIVLPTSPGLYNVQIFAYDLDNSITIFSNIFNVTV